VFEPVAYPTNATKEVLCTQKAGITPSRARKSLASHNVEESAMRSGIRTSRRVGKADVVWTYRYSFPL
jgi:hypothetical protein